MEVVYDYMIFDTPAPEPSFISRELKARELEIEHHLDPTTRETQEFFHWRWEGVCDRRIRWTWKKRELLTPANQEAK